MSGFAVVVVSSPIVPRMNRRASLAMIAGCTATALSLAPSAAALPPDATVSARGGVLASATAETGDASAWCYIQSGVRDGVGVSTDVARVGEFSYRAEVRDGTLIYNSERSEFSNGPGDCEGHKYSEGDETWTAFSWYPAQLPRYESWSNLAQFKEPHGGPPPVSVTLADGDVIFRARYNTGVKRWNLGPIERGQWNDFVIHMKSSSDPNVGFVEVYRQGELVVPRTAARTMEPGSKPLFLAVGHYRDKANTGTAVVYVDAVKVGTTKESVAIE